MRKLPELAKVDRSNRACYTDFRTYPRPGHAGGELRRGPAAQLSGRRQLGAEQLPVSRQVVNSWDVAPACAALSAGADTGTRSSPSDRGNGRCAPYRGRGNPERQSGALRFAAIRKIWVDGGGRLVVRNDSAGLSPRKARASSPRPAVWIRLEIPGRAVPPFRRALCESRRETWNARGRARPPRSQAGAAPQVAPSCGSRAGATPVCGALPREPYSTRP